MDDILKAKDLFLSYNGSHYVMAREGVFDKYKTFGISKETEGMWLSETIEASAFKLKDLHDNRSYAEAIEAWSALARQLGDRAYIDHMLAAIEKKKLDSYSLLRVISAVIELMRNTGGCIADLSQRKRLETLVITLKQQELSMDSSYANDPYAIGIDLLKDRIAEFVQYCKTESII